MIPYGKHHIDLDDIKIFQRLLLLRNSGIEKNSNNLPNSYEYYEGALSIPLYYDLTRKQQTHVINQVKKLIG